MEHVAEEIEDLRDCASWRRSIVNSQERIAVRLQDSRKRIAGHLYARGAMFETGVTSAALPDRCPFTVDQLLGVFDVAWPEQIKG